MSIEHNAALVIAGDTKTALSATDDALLNQTLLFASTIQAAKVIELPVGTTQRLYASHAKGVQGLLDSRQAVQESISLMHGIARSRGLDVVLEGCIGGFPMGAVKQSETAENIEQPARV